MPVTPIPRRLVLTLETVPWRPSPWGTAGYRAQRHTCCAACSTEHSPVERSTVQHSTVQPGTVPGNAVPARIMALAAVPDSSSARFPDATTADGAAWDSRVVPFPFPGRGPRRPQTALWDREAGMATAEYAIATLAAVAFAGLLAAVLGSGDVRSLLMGLIRTALSFG